MGLGGGLRALGAGLGLGLGAWGLEQAAGSGKRGQATEVVLEVRDVRRAVVCCQTASTLPPPPPRTLDRCASASRSS